MVDLDKSGHGFQRVRTYLGPSLGWKDELVQPTTEISTGGVYNVSPGDSLILVDVAAAVTINLPNVISWMQQPADQPATGFDRSITVKDLGGNANSFNIVITPFAQQAIDNVQASMVMSVARSTLKFIPLIDLSGWTVLIASASGGGGGGGDVFKAGNNTYTGTNTFQNTVTVPTLPLTDNTSNAASTGYVKSQNYITGAALAPYALLTSPTFLGDPKAPTKAPPTDNTTSIATTEFVQSAIAATGGGAPLGADYVTSTANATLTAERVLTDSATVAWDRSVSGQIKANTVAGGGNVSSSGTPTNGQYAKWVTATTIQGIAISSVISDIGAMPTDPTLVGLATITGTTDNIPYFTGPDIWGQIPTTAYGRTIIGAADANGARIILGAQPLDGDLTALSGLLGTNTIYYRSATDIWSPVTFSGLTFSGGILSVSGGGGNVSSSGTPNLNELAQWNSSTTIKGLPIATLFDTPTFTGLVTISGGASANNLRLSGAPAGSAPSIIASGTDANIDVNLSTRGTGSFKFLTNSNTLLQVQITNTAGATTPLGLTGGIGSSSIATIGGGPVNIANANLTGSPTAVTAAPGDNDTSVATTAFVAAAIAAAGGGGGGFTTGDVKFTIKLVPDTGWVIMDDRTIGSVSSGATNRANADCQSLFNVLYQNLNDDTAPVFTSAGVGTTRAALGTAAAAWAANARIQLMITVGRAFGNAANGITGSGLTSRSLGTYLGAESVTQSIGHLVPHTHTTGGLANITTSPTGGYVGPGGGLQASPIDSAGGGAALGIMDPSIYLNVMMKL